MESLQSHRSGMVTDDLSDTTWAHEESEGSVCLNCDEEMKPIFSLGSCPHCGGGVVLVEDLDRETTDN